eukprot:64871-Pleurochrysis_carterae.AAC.1
MARGPTRHRLSTHSSRALVASHLSHPGDGGQRCGPLHASPPSLRQRATEAAFGPHLRRAAKLT